MKEFYFKRLVELSKMASNSGEVPVSAILVCNEKIVAEAYNNRNYSNNVFDHAEIMVIREYANKINNWHLNNCELYVTIEPCDMCKLFIKESRIKVVYYMLSRLNFKKNYFKTEFLFANISTELVKEYRKMLKNFWKDRR